MFDNDRFLCCYSLVVCECSFMSLCLLIAEPRTYASQSCTRVAFENSSVELSFPTTRVVLDFKLLSCSDCCMLSSG